MASNAYMSGRIKYSKPQAIIWADEEPVLSNGLYLPVGLDQLASDWQETDSEFIILSDHNRGPLEFSVERIEQKKRTINGRMRSYHVADKLRLDISWEMLPSKSYSAAPEINTNGVPATAGLEYTVDGGAGGAEILDWYNNHQGSFWMLVSYDNYRNTPYSGADPYSAIAIQRYTQAIEVFFSDFKYSVQKRTAGNYDFWNVSVSLEEA